MKVCCYAEPKAEGVLLHYPSLAVKGELIKICNYAKEKSGGYVTFDITRVYKARSNLQNRFFWGVLQQIAQETGNDLEDVEEAVKDRALKRGYPSKANKLTGRLKPLSMTKVNTVEMGYLLDEVIQLASELGIVVDTSELKQIAPQKAEDEEEEYTGDIF